ncbi:MAG: hypothetical protein NXH75_06305 [Halobacteriovoraceae bacterium]|nr:hypothetical protein [Halobacteriovoraceae bacterium]
MKNLSLILLVSLLPLLFSSAPREPIVKQKGVDLKIVLKAGHGIKFLGWNGSPLKEVKEKQKEIILTRQGWGKLPNEILVIPKDNSQKPDIVNVNPQNKEHKFEPSWQGIQKDEIIYWGQTPQGVCTMFVPLEETNAAVIFVTFPKSKVYSDGGSFFVTFKKQKVPLYFHVSTYHGTFSSVESLGVEPATQFQKKHCDRYHGGPCDKVFQVPEKAYGKLHRLKFGDVKKSSESCPV